MPVTEKRPEFAVRSSGTPGPLPQTSPPGPPQLTPGAIRVGPFLRLRVGPLPGLSLRRAAPNSLRMAFLLLLESRHLLDEQCFQVLGQLHHPVDQPKQLHARLPFDPSFVEALYHAQ